MKKILLVALLSIVTILSFGTVAKADTGVRYNTFTTSNGHFVRTQTAYIALSESYDILGENLNTPNDIYIDKSNYVYIASTDSDAGTGKIIKFNLATNVVKVIGSSFLINPTGVFVNETGEIFVADKDAQKAYKLDSEGNIIMEYTKPTSPLFGTDEFKPRKIVASKNGTVYILNNGSKGLAQFSPTGDFEGYFGTNYIAPSFRTVLQYTFFTDEQRANLFNISPPEISNMTIDTRGLIHTVSLGIDGYGIKRLNISGEDLLPEMINQLDLIDIYVGPIGNIYTVSGGGYISEYDIEGNLLFQFGGQDESNQIKGLFNTPTSIAVDANYNIYVLDSGNKEMQIFTPTEFASLVHTALSYYQDGKYLESKGPWEEVLKMNDLFDLAHKGLGNAYYSLGEYQKALQEYNIANDRTGFSDAYWEVRNQWLLDNVGTILIITFALILMYLVNLKLRYTRFVTAPIKKLTKKTRDKSKTIDQMLYMFTYLKNPSDASYEIKRKNKVGMFSATIILIIFFLFYIIYIYNMNFLFNSRVIADINVSEEMLKIFLPILLWIGSNYLVSSIREGEGRFRDVYITTIFSLSPFFLTLPVLTLISQVLTYNEEFIINFLMIISIMVTAVYFFFMVKETHYYQVKETFSSILISFFTMIMLLLGSIIIYILVNELITLLKDIVMEVFFRG